MKKIISILCAILLLFPNLGLTENTFSMLAYTANENAKNWQDNLFFQRMFEKFGITVSITQYNSQKDYLNALSTFGTNEENSDIIFNASLSNLQLEELFAQGQIAALDEFIDLYMPNLSKLLVAYPEIKKIISVNGKILSLPYINPYPSQNYMWINQSWLTKLNLPLPTNIGELFQTLEKFKTEDPNGNGRNDELPISFNGIWDLKFLSHGFGIIADDFQLYNENGPKFALYHPNYYSFVQFLKQLYQNGLLDKDGFNPLSKINSLQESPKENIHGLLISPTPFQTLPKNLGEEYVLLPPFTYGGKQEYRKLLDIALPGTMVLSSKAKNLEQIFSWLDYLYSEEGAILFSIGVEGEEYKMFEDGTWEWINGTAEALQEQLSESTLSLKGFAPYLEPFDFQKKFDDAAAKVLLNQIEDYAKYLRTPLPYMEINSDEASYLNAIFPPIGQHIDETLSRFILGELELTESSWASFLNDLKELNLDSYMDFWTKRYNK